MFNSLVSESFIYNDSFIKDGYLMEQSPMVGERASESDLQFDQKDSFG